MNEVTRILDAIKPGNPAAENDLLPVVYDELRRLARYRMASEAAGHTLQPTALVHEAWLRLTKGEAAGGFADSRHFFAAAAEAMRRILVESARRKKCVRHGGALQRVEMDGVDLALPVPDDDLLAMHEALDKLATVDARSAEVVKLCFFVGLTHYEAAQQLDVSLSTVERLWAFARAWLFREIKRTRASPPQDETI